MSKFNIGDKVKRVSPTDNHEFWNCNTDGMYHGNIYTVSNCDNCDKGDVSLEECRKNYMEDYFELVEPAKKQFTKSDLKDGMRVVYRNGRIRYVLGSTLLIFDGSKFSSRGTYQRAGYVASYDNDMKNSMHSELDIMQVVDRDGTVLYNRVEKSPTEIELEKLQEQYKQLGEQINKLKNTL